MLTIIELLMQLPEDVRQLAVDNAIKEDERFAKSKYKSIQTTSSALSTAFLWSTTEQGQDFWYNIKKSLR